MRRSPPPPRPRKQPAYVENDWYSPESTPPFPELNTGPLALSPRTQSPKLTTLSPLSAWRLSDPIFMLFRAVHVTKGHPQSWSTISPPTGHLGFGTACLSACVCYYLECPACAVHVLVLSCLAKAGLRLNSNVCIVHLSYCTSIWVEKTPKPGWGVLMWF